MPNDVLQKGALPQQTKKPGLFRTLLTASFILTAALSCIYLNNPQPVQFINLKTTDIILKTIHRKSPLPTIITVDIDEKSLETYGQWPWPRYRVAQLLKIIKDGGAKSIGIDILFAEPDRTSPQNWQKMVQNDFGINVKIDNIPGLIVDHDAYLTKTLAAGPFVLGYEFLFNSSQTEVRECNLHPVFLVGKTPDADIGNITPHRASGVLCNYKPLTDAVYRSGFFNGNTDIDGITRRLPLLITFAGRPFPSFALAVLMQYDNSQSLLLQNDTGGTSYISFANRRIAIDGQLNYHLGSIRQHPSGHLSAGDILNGGVTTAIFKDAIVLVGSTATGLTQLYPTIYSANNSLLDLHKYCIEALASKFQVKQAAPAPIVETGVTWLFCLLLTLAVTELIPLWSTMLAVFFIIISWIGAGVIYRQSGYIFSPLLPTAAIFSDLCLISLLRVNFLKKQAKSETSGALQLLKFSETTLQSILNTIPDIIFRLDKHGLITFISPAISKYLPPATPLLGLSIFDLVIPEDLPKVQNKLNERRTGERATTNLEVRLRLSIKESEPRETIRFFSISAEGIYQDRPFGHEIFLGTQGIIRDITELKRLENQLIQAQKMEMLGNLAAGIAHDLNNILSGMVSYPDLLLLEIPPDSPLRDKIAIIQKSGQKAATIVQDLLTLARRNVDINEPCNINEIINDYLNSIEYQRIRDLHPGATININLQQTLMNTKGSAIHLSKMIMNILHNGLEAMPSGGEITITTTNTSLSSPLNGYENIPAGDYICLTIADEGVGIPTPDLQRIFEPFYTRKAKPKSGTGLGMTIIWATVKDHNGFIDIISREGCGTTFKIYLPTTREESEPATKEISLDDFAGSETILIVDDIAEQLEIAKGLLSRLGYNVVTADGGAQALEEMGRRSFDLVILDMIMPPGIDGLETYRQMLKIVPQQKAIITSGFSESKRVKKLQQLGIATYIQKPYSIERLAMAVRKELDK